MLDFLGRETQYVMRNWSCRIPLMPRYRLTFAEFCIEGEIGWDARGLGLSWNFFIPS